MTGIERLRNLAKTEMGFGFTGAHDVLTSIADQIEREHAEDCFRMGERAAEDREAAAWVREHGGLDHVRVEWSSRVPHDLYERRRQRLLDHIAECETALGRRNHRIEELGKTIEFFQLNNSNFRHLLADVAKRLGFTRYGDDYEPEDLLDALDRRLIPEGCEWPRYDTGEPVRIGGTVADELGYEHVVTSVELHDDGADLHWNPAEPEECVWVGHGEPVRRPAKPEPPDSWERIEEDADKETCEYFDHPKGMCSTCPVRDTVPCLKAKNKDLVRRCRALAERERGE